jgi:anti-sigma factor RsiW
VGIEHRTLNQGQEARLAAEVQSAHVRSLMANHLTDITSTDQHTVKPWFNGKLDFSPPVEDLSPQGFPLIGGRLDYLDGHPVAALVYQRNKHDINLFIWPSTTGDEGLGFSTYNGYNVYHWTQSGMAYWAVSDLNPDELKGFVELVQKNFR